MEKPLVPPDIASLTERVARLGAELDAAEGELRRLMSRYLRHGLWAANDAVELPRRRAS